MSGSPLAGCFPLDETDPDQFTKRLGAVFRSERERQQLSQNQLSKQAGVARTGIIMFERGDRVPTVFVCKALANALGLKLSTLVRRAEDTPHSSPPAP